MSKVKQLRTMREAQFTTNGAKMTSNVPAKASGRLAELEATIEKSAKAVWDMAEALKEIHDDELWNQTHSSWKAYCEDRWNIGIRWAFATIQAVEIRKQLEGAGVTSSALLHVKQASELGRIPERDRAHVWNEAVNRAEADGKPSPSLHRHLEPAIKDYKAESAIPQNPPTPAFRAREAARDVKIAGEGFKSAVHRLLKCIDDLDTNDAQSAAYAIVETVHVVIGALQDSGHLGESVARSVTGGGVHVGS